MTRGELSQLIVDTLGLKEDSGAAAPDFPDVPPDHPYHQAIAIVSSHGMINGYGDGTFRPEETIRRSNAARLFCGVAPGLELSGEAPTFRDVSSAAMYYDAVIYCCRAGIMSGRTATTFEPEAPVLRSEINTAPIIEQLGTGRGEEYRINGISLMDSNYRPVSGPIPTDNFYAEVSITNLSSGKRDVVILAAYDRNGRQLGLHYMSADPAVGQTLRLGVLLDNRTGEIGLLKAFTLPMLGGWTPLSNTVEYPART